MPPHITNRHRVLVEAGRSACCSSDHFSFELVLEPKEALAREERGTGARYTTTHFARIVEGEAGSAPLLELTSTDMPREFLEELAADPASAPALAERIRAALAQDPFHRAFAIFVLVRQLAHQLGYGSPPASGVVAARR